MAKFKESFDDKFDLVLESLEQNYSVWFNALHKPTFQKYLSELEQLTHDIAATAPGFASFDVNRDLGMMILKYRDKSLVFANGSYKIVKSETDRTSENSL